MELRQYCTVRRNEEVQNGIFHMVLSADPSGISNPGQFVHILVEENRTYLRRPISIADWGKDYVELYYRVVGEGTEILSQKETGEKLDCLLPLGNGFTVMDTPSPILLGGGIGVPPLLGIAREYRDRGIVPMVALGFNSASDVIMAERFRDLGCEVRIATVDGTAGEKGFVTNLLDRFDRPYTYFHACGPEPMLKAVCLQTNTAGQCSFEERMACGIGACMGCTCKTKYGNKRICKDGPVLLKEEIIW